MNQSERRLLPFTRQNKRYEEGRVEFLNDFRGKTGYLLLYVRTVVGQLLPVSPHEYRRLTT